jgi:DNA-binding SARP family transcriptional activator/tetratricopeptide (TPR) repeat protein
MWLGVLGPLQVEHDEIVIAVPAAKQRVVLATLLVHANRVVPAGELSRALWGEAEPAQAGVTLRNYVKRLRQNLGPAAAAKIRTHPPGYRIDIGEHELDILKFAKLTAVAGEAVRQQSWAAAQAALDAALALWRGAPLADIPSEALRRDEVPRLEQLHLQAVEWHLEARLHLGGHAELVPQLRALATAQPMRERWHALLMLALYRCGRQAESLAAYRDARRLLIDDLGVEPGAEMRALHQRILESDPRLMAQQLMTGPAPPRTRWLDQAGPPEAERQPTLIGPPPRQLPPGTRCFSGRASALARLTGLLAHLEEADGTADGTVVVSVITGAAGVGKTTLALHWAHQVAARFPDGQLYVDLRGFDPCGVPVPPAEAIRGFLDALQVPSAGIPASTQAQAGLYRSLLADRGLLIVLDNARDADQVRPLLPTGQGCLVLVTSRTQLTGLVAAFGAHPLILDLPTEAEAAELLARRLDAAQVADEPAAVTDVARLCARLPLALSIAAAHAATRTGVSLAALSAQLREAGLDALATGEATTDVRAVFSWSYQRLSAPAARMFRLLGTHPGPDISVGPAASLTGTEPGQARQALTELADARLADEHVPGRYTLHDLLRSYAAELACQHDSPRERDAATRRVLDHYLHTACRADRLLYPARDHIAVPACQPGVTPDDLTGYHLAWDWFTAERQVLTAAAARAADRGLAPHAWQLPWALVTYLDRHGRWRDSAALQAAALSAAQAAGDLHGQAQTCRNLASAYFMLGDLDRSEPYFYRAMTLFEQLGDLAGQARSALDIVRLLAHRGHHQPALKHAQQALRLFQAVGHRSGQARALNTIGWQHAQLGHAAEALSYCGQALGLQRELGDRLGQAATLDSLGYIHRQLGDQEQAVTCYQRAVELCAALGASYYQADALSHLGDLHAAAGEHGPARASWLRALAILDELRHPKAAQLRAKLGALAVASSVPAT